MKPIDSYDMFEYAHRADVTKYLTWLPHPSREYTRDYLEFIGKCYRNGEFYDWALIWCADGEYRETMIGTCGFTRFDPPHNKAEIGYVLNPDYHGRGYATEAAERVIAYGFEELDLHRIEARFMSGNSASLRVTEKLGMTFEGYTRDGMLVKGSYKTIGISAILDYEWRRKNG